MGILQQAYSLSPPWLQNVGITTYGYLWKRRRFGGTFLEEVNRFERRESLDGAQWSEYQTFKLRELMLVASKHVPFYSDLFRSSGHKLDHLAQFTVRDLPSLPLLEKESLRGREPTLLSNLANPRKLSSYATSGTTGTPVNILFSATMHQAWSAAYEVRCRRWAGVDYTMKRAMIGGRLVVPNAKAKPPFWRFNWAEKQLYMSAFHISPENTKHYVEALNKFQPDYLVGYASAHYFLARMITEEALKVHSPKAVITSSENLTAEMRATIQGVYGCEVFDAYSGVEACCLTSECESHAMHVSPDVGIVELIGADGKPVAAGEQGEIVATGLLNFDQPLIRYRTGDWAVFSDRECPCGRRMPVIEELVGRLEDTVVTSDGKETVRFHGIFVGLPHVREGQVIQETYTDFRVKLVVEADFTDEEERAIRDRFQERLGPIDLRIEIVPSIERTQRGKFRAVISKVERTGATGKAHHMESVAK